MKISIIIPCYNEIENLKRTPAIVNRYINKLIDEKKVSGSSFIIFVDDGSDDFGGLALAQHGLGGPGACLAVPVHDHPAHAVPRRNAAPRRYGRAPRNARFDASHNRCASVAASAFVSTEETILLVNGSRNMAWEGVHFQHATWDQPSTARGYVDWQAGTSGGIYVRGALGVSRFAHTICARTF